MIPLKQRFRHDPDNGVWGDCHRAAIASVLELALDDVPHFADGGVSAEAFNAAVDDFLAQHGLRSISSPFSGDLRDVLHTIGTLNGGDLVYLLGGTSRTGVNHTVVCVGSEIAHDPSLSDSGIVGPCDDGYYWVSYFAPLSLSRRAMGPVLAAAGI